MSVVAEQIREHYLSTHTNHTEDKKLFLAGLRETGVVQGGLDRAGICRATAYAWRNLDTEFRAAWDEAREACNDNVRQTIYQQAVAGKNPLFSIFYAKHNCPEYNERVQVDIHLAQREIEEQIDGVRERAVEDESLRRRLPSASAKDIIADALGLPRRRSGLSSSSSPDSPETVVAHGPDGPSELA